MDSYKPACEMIIVIIIVNVLVIIVIFTIIIIIHVYCSVNDVFMFEVIACLLVVVVFEIPTYNSARK